MNNTQKYPGSAEDFHNEAFRRNIGILTKEEQEKLRVSKIAIAGMGGVGGFHLMNLVRLGVGKFHIADTDCYEAVNIQRQCGAFVETLGESKVEVMKKMALSANPFLEISSFPQGVSSSNIAEFLSGADLLLDGIDFFCIEERRMIFSEARKRGMYAITAGPIGFSSALLIFSPDGMSFDEYFDLNDKMSYLEKVAAFGVGLTPAAVQLKYMSLRFIDLAGKSGPSLASACNLCGALAATEAVNILLKRKVPKAAPFYFQFDPYEHVYKKGYLLFGNRNPIQRIKRRYLLWVSSNQRKRGAKVISSYGNFPLLF